MFRACGLLFLTSLIVNGATADDLPAFPGAEGAGLLSRGGRGGRVIFVTSLADDPKKPLPGTLRAAVQASGPRIVIFEVGGLIELQAPLVVREPFLTIAGQTAPGDGICLKNFPLLINRTHDVIVRHLRVRPGDAAGKELDGLSVLQSQRVVIDHCSVSWSIDEAVSVTGAGCTDVTVQWCCIAEGLNASVHEKGSHGYGALIRTDGKVSYHHNLFAHFQTRCPRPGTYGDKPGELDFRNNLIYDWIGPPGYSAQDPARMNYVGNFLKPGPSTTDSRFAFDVGGSRTQLFLWDIIIDGKSEPDLWRLISHAERIEARLGTPIPFRPVTTIPADTLMDQLLPRVGAMQPRRDAVDRRIVQDVKNGTGNVIDSPAQVNGWPSYAAGTAPTDSDRDGIPDDWERQARLDPLDAADALRDANGNGWPDLEDYLHQLASREEGR
jgi:hypothetical protein